MKTHEELKALISELRIRLDELNGISESIKCEHGNSIVVLYEARGPYTDDGFYRYDKDGNVDYGGDYFEVIGCPNCRLIKIRWL